VNTKLIDTDCLPTFGCFQGAGNENEQWFIHLMTRDGYLEFVSTNPESAASVKLTSTIRNGLMNPNIYVEIKNGVLVVSSRQIDLAKEGIEQLVKHPFTLLSLSDREKFHTGFLAYLINEHECGVTIANEIFAVGNKSPEWNKPIKALVEYDSVDLLLCQCNEFGKEACGTFSKPCEPKKYAIALAEVKLKTDLHSDQLEKLKQKIKKDVPIYLISLFPTTEPVSDTVAYTCFDLCNIPDILSIHCDIPSIGEPSIVGMPDDSALPDNTKALLSLWSAYLNWLKFVVDYFIEQEMKAIDPKIVNGLRSIKLLGIFQRYRFSLIKKALQQNGRKVEAIIHNSHGESLLHIFFLSNKYQVGLQWQYGILKLFIESDQAKDPERDQLLVCLAKKLGVDKKLNRDGKFRSITWRDDWDVMGDISRLGKELEDHFKEVREAWEKCSITYTQL
jgi:hypothetical protein